MVTTIQIKEDTRDTLKRLRTAYQVQTYDEVLKKMQQELQRKESLAGILKGVSKSRLLEGLRDKHDRF